MITDQIKPGDRYTMPTAHGHRSDRRVEVKSVDKRHAVTCVYTAPKDRIGDEVTLSVEFIKSWCWRMYD